MKQIIEELVAPLQGDYEMSALWDMMLKVVNHAETWVGLTSGVEKKKFAMEVLETVLQHIDLPGPDWVARRVILWLAPSLIDVFVEHTL